MAAPNILPNKEPQAERLNLLIQQKGASLSGTVAVAKTDAAAASTKIKAGGLLSTVIPLLTPMPAPDGDYQKPFPFYTALLPDVQKIVSAYLTTEDMVEVHRANKDFEFPANIEWLAPDLVLKSKIMKENPEYRHAMEAWEIANVSLNDQVYRLVELRQYAFGTDKWFKHIGSIFGEVPSFPANIFELINSPDSIDSSKKIKDTHVLVLVPGTVIVNSTSVDISIASLGNLVKSPKEGHSTCFNCFDVGEYVNRPVGISHWILMRKEVISRNEDIETYERQQDIVREYSQKAKAEYIIPYAVDVVACIFMHFLSTGNRIFGSTNQPNMYSISTRYGIIKSINPPYIYCQELVNGQEQISVGGFYPTGLNIHRYKFSNLSNAVGVMRILASH